FDTGQIFSKSITPGANQFHGNRKLAMAQAQFISAAALTKSRRRNARWHAEQFPRDPSCWSHNKVCSIQHARRAVNTRSGAIVMFHLTATSTCQTKLNRRSNGLRPVFAIAFSPVTQ